MCLELPSHEVGQLPRHRETETYRPRIWVGLAGTAVGGRLVGDELINRSMIIGEDLGVGDEWCDVLVAEYDAAAAAGFEGSLHTSDIERIVGGNQNEVPAPVAA